MRPVVDAAVIAALRAQVIEHNKANPSARVKLQELKKAWIRGYWKRGAHTAEAAVQKHLAKRLGSVVVSPESIAALAKAEFDESKVRRDGDGKFAPKGGAGGGRRAAFDDVRSRDQYSALRSENEGYRADTTQVIPNTVGATFAPWLAAGGVTVLGAGRTALADKSKGPDAIGRIGGRMTGAAVGVPAGVIAGQVGYLGAKAGNAMRAKLGGKQADPAAVADRFRQKVRSGAMRAVNRTTTAMDRAFYFIPRSLIQSAKEGADADGLKGARRTVRVMARGRVPAAAYGGIAAGLVAAPLFYRGGQVVGPMYDYFTPRRVEKMAKLSAPAESVEMLNKAAIPGMAGLRQGFQGLLARLRSNATAAAAQAPKAAAKAPKAAAPATGANRKAGTTLARQQMSRFRRSPGVGAALGGLAGGAVAGAAALGVRRYYRDEDGKFTSKDRDVSGMVAAGGAAAGALAGFAFTRGRNQAFARRLAEGARRIAVEIPDTAPGAKGDATQITTLQQALQRVREGRIKRQDISLPARGTAIDEKAGMSLPDEVAARRDRKIRAIRAEAQESIRKEMQARQSFAERVVQANKAGEQDWQRFQMDRVLREQLGGLTNDAAFKGPSEKSIKELKLTGPVRLDAEQRINARRLLRPDEVVLNRRGPKALSQPVRDPIGGVIAHARQVNAAEVANKAPPANDLWDQLTAAQRDAIRANVRRADDALEAASQRFTARSKLQDEINSLRDQQARLKRDSLAPGESADMLEDGGAKAKRQKRAQADLDKVEKDLAAKTAEFDRDFKGDILAENPFLAGARLKPKMEAKELQSFLDEMQGPLPKASAKMAREEAAVDSRFVQEAINYLETAERAGKGSAARRLTGSAFSRVGAPISEFARQSKRILGDAKEAVQPKLKAAYETGKDFVTRGNEAVFGENGVGPVVGRKITNVKQWLRDNPKAIPFLIAGGTTGLTGLAGIGIDYAADGKVNFRFTSPPEAWKQLQDTKSKPQAAVYLLNGGRDVAYVVVGKTKPSRGQEAMEVVLSGSVIRQNGESTDVTPLTPLKMFLDNNRGGGGGGGGQRSVVELSGVQAKAIGDAIGALRRDNKIQRRGDEEEGYEYRHKDDSAQDNAAREYLSAIKKTANNSRNGDGFYGYLAAVFGPDGAILKEHEKRQAIFGSKKDGKQQNDGLINGGNAFIGYSQNDNDKLFSGLKERIEGLKPAPTEEQAVSLRHMVNLASIGGQRLDNKQVQDLRRVIAGRIGGGAPAAAGAGQANAGNGPRTIQSKDDYLRLADTLYERFQQEAKKQFGQNAAGMQDANWQASARYMAESSLKEIRDRDEARDWSDQRVYEEAIREMRRSLQLKDRGNQAKKSFDQDAFLRASIEVLAKASIPAEFQGSRRQFEETKIRRAPKGSDKGGEFAPKAGGGAGGAPSRRNREPAPKEDKRSYFEATRFGNTLGSAIGSQGAFEIASRFLPGPLKTAGFAKRLAFQLGAAMAGGVAGGMAGEEIGRATYTMRGKAPPKPFEPPDRPLTEEAARTAGNMGGSMLSALTRSPMRGFGIGVGGQLSGEELAAGVHDVVARLYGQDIAAQARAAVTPRRQQA